MQTLRSNPLYSQVRDELARQIAEQRFPAGSVLPNELVLAEAMGVSVGTVRKALELLRTEKMVIRSQGRGTVVAGAGSSDFRGKFDRVRTVDGSQVSWQFEILERNVRLADTSERVVLNLQEGEEIVEIHRLRRVGNRPVKSEHSRVPLSAFGNFTDLVAADTTIESLAYRNGVMISLLDERISIVQADARLARQLSVAKETPLLRLERMVFDGADAPLEWRITYCHLEGYRYHASASISSRPSTPRRTGRVVEPRADPRSWRPELA
jgi:GntR family transcriptional regulator